MNSRPFLALLAGIATASAAGLAIAQGSAPPADAPSTPQTVLGPGLYVFQTRITAATCGDADRTGDVTSYYAAIDGIPGSRQMRMGLLNSRFWPSWTLNVTANDHVVGDADQEGVTGPHRGHSHFDVGPDNGRFTGQGTREYSRQVGTETARCRVTYDALLKRIDR
ncbi:MAG: hypothetical protein U0230_15715 [Polyangiales bacterium]